MDRYIRIFVFVLYSFSVAVLTPVQAQDLLDYPLDTVKGEEVYLYHVERSIGLYRIGINFNVTQEEIIRFNPHLRERGVRYNELLYIPTHRPVIFETKPVVVETVITERVVLEPSAVRELPAAPEPSAPQQVMPEPAPETVAPEPAPETVVPDPFASDPRPVVELALLLPFESQQTKRSANAERMMEFYQGALLALYERQNDSVRYRLRVFDSERSERRVRALCDSTELDSVKAILGLAYPIQIERMAEWCDLHQVPLILPFSDDTDLAHRPHLLQFNSSDRQEADSLCSWISAQDSVRCIAIETRETELSEPVRHLHRCMRAQAIPYTTVPVHDLLTDSADYALDSLYEHLVILPGDRYQAVRLLLPHIAKWQQAGYRVRIVSQYSWQKENINLPQIYTSMFTSEALQDSYEALWNRYFTTGHVSDSPRYDILGYDLMHATLAWLQGIQEVHGLQSDIRWTQVENGGWQNANVKVVVK